MRMLVVNLWIALAVTLILGDPTPFLVALVVTVIVVRTCGALL